MADIIIKVLGAVAALIGIYVIIAGEVKRLALRPDKKYRVTYGIAATYIYAQSKRQARRIGNQWCWIYREWREQLHVKEVKEDEDRES